MIETIQNKLEEISLMLVMTSEGDAAGVQLILDLCDELVSIATGQSFHSQLKEKVAVLRGQQSNTSIVSLLNQFVEEAKQLGSGQVVPTQKSNVENIDSDFIQEYIENHLLLLEEFEGWIITFKDAGGDETQFTTSIKRYLHNLKGDSGSIGVSRIERVCHIIEDQLATTQASAIIPTLLAFKQWVIQCFDAYANGSVPPVTADEFLQTWKPQQHSASISTKAPEVAVASGVTKPAPKTQRSEPHAPTYAISGERDILLEFANEAEEHLNNVESVILDSDGSYSKESVDTIFRGVHSIKGGSAYFSIEEMTSCSHILENFLSEVRDGKRKLGERLNALLLTYIDLQKNVLKRAKEAAMNDGIITRSSESVRFLSSLEAYAKGDDASAAKSEPAPQAEAVEKSSESEGELKGDKLNLKTFVKVDTTRLDLLIDSIGEMVIYSSMLIGHCRELLGGNEPAMDAAQRVEKFSRDLQDIGMSMRLVPIKGLFQKMSRLVWDISKKIGKEVVFSMEGEDTELDRNLIDKLADPLMHMIRNSLDHGIESGDERVAKGKQKAGRVKLSAYHAGGSIHIKIQDDGKGLNPDKLLAKAVEKGIITPDQKLSTSDIHHLIFAPGFSTAAQVTDISGRGVGMDVVRRNVESLRGRIHIDSAVDQGSTFTIEIPLTLAIIDGIHVNVGTESFLIPSLSIVEFLKPSLQQIAHVLDNGETFKFRGKYLPVYRIADLFDLKPRYTSIEESTFVIVESNQEQVVLVVDEILGECSTVIKNLGPIFEEGKGLAGCAIMPKGNVALILDVRSLINLARKEYKRSGDEPVYESHAAAHV